MARAPAPRRKVVSKVSTGLRPTDAESARVWDIAATILDPEVPALTIEDLGVLREARAEGDTAYVVLTPTYSGCPAIDQMRDDVAASLREAGFAKVRVDYTLAPAWTTDWMSEEGKRKLEDYGIAPPRVSSAELRGPIPVNLGVKCPRCQSLHTRELSRFGSTACKAHYQCQRCQEPFDYFKVH